MRFSGGMSTKEIAEALGKTENNTRQIIYRGLNKLKEKDTTGLLKRARDQVKEYGIIRSITLLIIIATFGVLTLPFFQVATVASSHVANTATGQIQLAENNGSPIPFKPKQLSSPNDLIPVSSKYTNSQSYGNDPGDNPGGDQPVVALPPSSIPDDTQNTTIPLKPTNTPVSSPLPDNTTPTRQVQGNVPQSTAVPTSTPQNSAQSPLPTQPSQLAEPTAALPTSIQSATSLPTTTNTPGVTSQPTAAGTPVSSSTPTSTPGNSGASPTPTNTPVPANPTSTATPGNSGTSPTPTNTSVPSSTPTNTPGNSDASPTPTNTPVPSPTASSTPASPTPTATALPTATSTPTVTPCPPDQYQPLDITLVMDISGSMLDEDKLTYAKAAATEFASLLEPQDQLALVVFRNSADLRQQLTLDHQKVIAQIEKLEAGGDTSISAGITIATKELTSTRHRPDAQAVMILLTDGLAKDSLEDALMAAGAAKEQDIRLIAIGFGTPNSPFLDAVFLQNLVSSQADYHEAQDVNELTNVYESIRVVIHTCDSSPIGSGSELPGSPTPTPTIQPQLTPIKTTASLTESTTLIWNTWFPIVSNSSLTASSAESTSRLTMAVLLVALPVAYQTSNKGGSMTTITLSVPAEEIVQQSEVDDYAEQKNRSRNNALLQNQRTSQNNSGKKTNSLHSHWHNRGPPRVSATIVSTDVMLYGKDTAANQSLQLLWAAQIGDYTHYQHLLWWLPLCLLQYNATSVLQIQTAISSALRRVYRYFHTWKGVIRKEYLSQYRIACQRFCSHRCNPVECAWRYVEYGLSPPLLSMLSHYRNSPHI